MAESTNPAPLVRGDQVPHFEVNAVDGGVFKYSTIWLRKNLLLIVLPPSGSDAIYVSELHTRQSEFQRHETEYVVTRDIVAGLTAPAVLIADRWGEIIHVTVASDVARLPAAEDLLGWLEYIQNRCPECEGESK